MRAVLLAVLILLAFAGCGGEQKLTADEQLAVAEARVHFVNLVLDGSGYGESLDSVDKIIAICRKKPDATYDGLTMRQVLDDAAADLDGYRPLLATELREAAEN